MTYRADLTREYYGAVPPAPKTLDDALKLQQAIHDVLSAESTSPIRVFVPEEHVGGGAWGDFENDLTRQVAGFTVHREIKDMLKGTRGLGLRSEAALLGVLWNSNFLSGTWTINGLSLSATMAKSAVLDLPISDDTLGRLVMSDISGYVGNLLLREWRKRPVATPEHVLVAAELAFG